LDTETLEKLPGIESLYLPLVLPGNKPLDLGRLPFLSMRHLAISHWNVQDLAPLGKMTRIRQLDVEMFHESLEPVSRMDRLTYLKVLGPAKSWGSLGTCTELIEAILIGVQMASMKRWNTWKQLRWLCLGGA
jgi:hypothetical protein